MQIKCVSCEALTAVIMKSSIFGDITTCFLLKVIGLHGLTSQRTELLNGAILHTIVKYLPWALLYFAAFRNSKPHKQNHVLYHDWQYIKFHGCLVTGFCVRARKSSGCLLMPNLLNIYFRLFVKSLFPTPSYSFSHADNTLQFLHIYLSPLSGHSASLMFPNILLSILFRT